MIELYAFARHPGPALPDHVGDVFEVPFDGLAAICGPATSDGDEVTPESLWRYEEVVETLMRDRDLLPVRYGTRVAEATDAARAGAERADDLRSGLDRVSGAVELSLRVRTREQASGEGSDLHERLTQLARDAVRSEIRAEGEVLRSAYLVERDEVTRFTDEVAHFQAAHAELSLLLTGPWPPYSFAGAQP